MIDPRNIVTLVAYDQYSVPYRTYLRPLTGSVVGSILLSQMMYWRVKVGRKPFYKFKEPPKSENKYYEVGQSWCEELAFNRSEFDRAVKCGERITSKDDKTLILSQSLFVYWIDRERLTWYEINERYLGEQIGQLLLKQNPALGNAESCVSYNSIIQQYNTTTNIHTRENEKNNLDPKFSTYEPRELVDNLRVYFAIKGKKTEFFQMCQHDSDDLTFDKFLVRFATKSSQYNYRLSSLSEALSRLTDWWRREKTMYKRVELGLDPDGFIDCLKDIVTTNKFDERYPHFNKIENLNIFLPFVKSLLGVLKGYPILKQMDGLKSSEWASLIWNNHTKMDRKILWSACHKVGKEAFYVRKYNRLYDAILKAIKDLNKA